MQVPDPDGPELQSPAVALDCRLVTADRIFYNALGTSPHGPRLLWVAEAIPGEEDATP